MAGMQNRSLDKGIPATRPVAIKDLRLGDCLIAPLDGGRWAEGIVWYLGQEHEPDHEDGMWRYTFGVAPRRVALDRILNPAKYSLVPPPLASHLLDLTDQERIAMRPNPHGHVTTLVTPRKTLKAVPPLLRSVERTKLLLNGLDDSRIADGSFNLRALRHAAQTLRPDTCVRMEYRSNRTEATIKAVGFGLGGPLGILPFAAPFDFTHAAAGNAYVWQMLESDCWIDTARLNLKVIDPQRSNVTLKQFNHMKRVQIPHA